MDEKMETTVTAYFDITIANPYRKGITKKSSETRLAAAKELEKRKREKYKSIINKANQNTNGLVRFYPMGMEIHGNVTNNTKKIMRKIAKQISIRKVRRAEIEMQHIRTKIVNVIMDYNIKMIESIYDL